jgi:hypothetical protein
VGQYTAWGSTQRGTRRLPWDLRMGLFSKASPQGQYRAWGQYAAWGQYIVWGSVLGP